MDSPPTQPLPLPPRATAALDQPAPEVARQLACERLLDTQDICIAAAPCPSGDCTATLEWIRADGGAQPYRLRDISGDGTLLLAEQEGRGGFLWRWGAQSVSFLPHATLSYATAVNRDGTMVVGFSRECGPSCTIVPGRFTLSSFEPLPEDSGTPYDISGGSTVVGYGRPDVTLNGFLHEVGSPVTPVPNVALQGISADGSSAADILDSQSQLVLVTAAGSTSTVTFPDGYRADTVAGLSADGTYVAGQGRVANVDTFMFRLHRDGTLDVLLPPETHPYASVTAISGDGNVMVGWQNQQGATNPPPPMGMAAFYWTSSGIYHTLEAELQARGVVIPEGLQLQFPKLSEDGNTLMGSGLVGQERVFWRVRLAPPSSAR